MRLSHLSPPLATATQLQLSIATPTFLVPVQLTLFLDTWLQHPAGFTVVRLGESAMGAWEGERGRWVGWVGWCPPVDERE